MILRVCKKCNTEKSIDLFVKKKKKNGDVYILYTCLDCNKKYNTNYFKSYYGENKEELIKTSKDWYAENTNKKKEYDKNYGILNKNNKKIYDAEYRTLNKEKINKRTLKYIKSRKLNDPAYKLRKSISFSIWYYLNLNKSSKNNKSILQYLPYSMDELKAHLEKQFEPWMNWSNYGAYHIRLWNDNDQSSWTWNIDHIIPQSKLPYTSMEDNNFKQCWSLNNLRPYSAKQNIIDSNKR